MTRLEELNEELTKLYSEMDTLLQSDVDIVNDPQAESEFDYLVNSINRTVNEMSSIL